MVHFDCAGVAEVVDAADLKSIHGQDQDRRTDNESDEEDE